MLSIKGDISAKVYWEIDRLVLIEFKVFTKSLIIFEELRIWFILCIKIFLVARIIVLIDFKIQVYSFYLTDLRI